MTKLRLPWSLIGGLMATVAASQVLSAYDWGFGPTRGLILLILLISTIRLAAPAGPAPIPAWLDLGVWALLAAGAAMWIAAACGAVSYVERAGVIPLDGGQTSYRAARLWLQGENPYGTGALVDFSAFIERAPLRVEAGLATAHTRDEMLDALHAYDRTLDPSARAALLPAAPAGVENQVLGYKYGPSLLLASLPPP